MTWTDKLYNLRTVGLEELNRLLEIKDYDKSELSRQEMCSLPYTVYTGDLGSELFSIYFYDREGGYFMGRGWDSGEDFTFWFDDLETHTICNLIDLINEDGI